MNETLRLLLQMRSRGPGQLRSDRVVEGQSGLFRLSRWSLRYTPRNAFGPFGVVARSTYGTGSVAAFEGESQSVEQIAATRRTAAVPDPCDVVLDRLRRDEQAGADLLVREAFHQQGADLALAFGEHHVLAAAGTRCRCRARGRGGGGGEDRDRRLHGSG